jgi:hypothetical protein
MSTDDGTSGTLFEGLLNDDPQAKELANLFADKNLKIVSPTVGGFLSTLKSKPDFYSFKIEGCNIDYLSEFEVTTPENDKDSSEKNETILKEFAAATATFIHRVGDVRCSYIPPESKDIASSFGNSAIAKSKKESYENAFMRMLGMPSEADLKNNQFEKSVNPSTKLFYFSPDFTNSGKLSKKQASIAQILGDDNTGEVYSNILAERRKIIDPDPNQGSEKRTIDFTKVAQTDVEYKKIQDELKAALETAKGTPPEAPGDSSQLTEVERTLGYHIPDQLFRFYYLKSIPVQDSSVYGCIVEPSKIIAKPFDTISYQKINGIKPKTSFLETVIRLRLDRITGNPVIYGYSPSDPDSPLTTTPSNLEQDSITEIECFLIQKLKRILYLLAEKYIADLSAKEEIFLKQDLELSTGKDNNKSTVETAAPAPASGSGSTSSSDSSGKSNSVIDESTYFSEIQNLEILKAKEDAILFLLKDTSSSYSSGGAASQHSSLDIQEGIIRTSSGFSDVLSGPLFSILSHRSEYLDKLIKEKRQAIDALKIPTTPPGKNEREVDDRGFFPNPGTNTSTFVGVIPEDFIVYALALLIINQDYLIGLLPYENRKNLANTISNSIVNTGNKNKDPYGLIERFDKAPDDGGFPSVVDSVNALGLLASTLYEEYISYIKNQNVDFIQSLINSISTIRQS